MGFWGKLFGIGVAATAATAAVKVAQKYEENKAAENAAAAEQTAEQNATDFTENAAESTGADYVNDVMKAATDVYDETVTKVKDGITTAAEKAGVNTEELSGALTGAGKALADAGKAVVSAGSTVVNKITEDAPDFINKVKAQAGDVIDDVKDGADDLVNQVKDTVAGVTEPSPDAAPAEPQTPPTDDTNGVL
ncbi:MAG: hypothetical protein RRY96_06890 [Ruthenibacterium sp.]